MKIGSRLHLSTMKSAKYDGDIMIDKPRFGYNWFYILPNISWNKGNPLKKQVVDIRFAWLCFCFGFTLYPSWVNKKENQACQIKKTDH